MHNLLAKKSFFSRRRLESLRWMINSKSPQKYSKIRIHILELRLSYVNQRRSGLHQKRVIVTLVGKGQAKVGEVFIHRGPGSKCVECEYSQVCVENVKPGRVYEIVKVRDRTLFCRQYEMEMRVVEVVNAKIPSAIPAKQAIPGVIITFRTPICEEEKCTYYDLCFPEGLKSGDRCEVLEVIQSVQCPLGSPRKKVLLRLVSAS